jgi:hypothetical protein
MEAAGTFGAAFNRADPMRVIMVRGVCDRADSMKTEIDNTGVWRNAAAFNAAKFVRQFITFGNVDPLNCDKLTIKATSKAARDPRLGRRKGFSYPLFEKLLTPAGPLLNVTLQVRAMDEKDAPLKILRAIWSENTGGLSRDEILDNNADVLSIPITRRKPDYFSLQLEVAGAANRFVFTTTGAADNYNITYNS